MKTNSQANQNGSAYIVLINIIFIIILGALGFLFWRYILDPPLPTNASGVVIPDGWQSYTSKKYGLSFVMPKGWTVKEAPVTYQYRAQTNPRYTISTYPSGRTTSSDFYFTVYENTLDSYVTAEDKYNQQFFAHPFYDPVTSLKWNGDDARRMFIDPVNATAATARYYLLFVQVGKFVYDIPDSENTPADVLNGVVSTKDWQTMTASIRIEAG